DLREFWRTYDEWCRAHGVLTTFVRFHPLYANAHDAPIHVEPLAPTIAWRLEEEDLVAGMHLNHRRAVRKAQKAGVTVVVGGGLVAAAVGKAVHDETAYARITGGNTSFDGHFPAYRRAGT